MKIILIEDEPLVAKHLQNLIHQVNPAMEILTVLDSLKNCISYFKTHPEPDLLFMDIQLSDGVSFDLLNEVDLKCPIIFTTAYDEYAIRAFKLNSIDYLLKPIDKIELKSALDKYHRLQGVQGYDFKDQVQELLKHIDTPKNVKSYKERFMVHSGKSFMVINASNIAYFIKETLIYIVTKDKEKFVTDFQTMEEVEELINPEQFYRANRQMIIQADAVESFRPDIYGKLVAKLKSPNGISVDISRERAQAFKKWIQ